MRFLNYYMRFIFGPDDPTNTGYSFPLPTDMKNLLLFGYPRRSDNNWSVIVTFPASVWLSIGATAGLVALVLVASMKVYHVLGKGAVRHRAVGYDVCLQVLATLTEPQGINLFVEWSSG